METKNNVRQRRMERIRKLQESAERRAYPMPGSPEEEPLYRGPYQEQETRQVSGPIVQTREDAGRWNDPEYVWKNRWQRELYNEPYERSTGYGGTSSRWGPSRKSFRWKMIISCVLFAMVYGVFQLNQPWANKGKAYIASALQEPFNFQPIALWYEKQFGGTPSLLPALNPSKPQDAEKVTAFSKHYFSPVKGKVIAPYEQSRLGVTLETKAEATVSAIDTGLVVYVGSKEDTGYTVILRHTNGLQSVYGWIEQGRVELNDWVKGGETIGTVSKNSTNQLGYLYFAVSKDNKFVNPSDVVGFE